MATFKIQKSRTKGGKKIKEEKEITIDVGTEGAGTATALTEEELDVRRFMGLPTTKDLVYYPSSREDKKIPVDKFVVDQVFTITEPWFILILYMGEETVKIHHRYFVEMQSPTFVSDMNKVSTQE